MQSKVLIEYSFKECAVPADRPEDPDEYSYVNVVNRKSSGQLGIDWLPEDLGASLTASYEQLKENLISALVVRDALPAVTSSAPAPDSMVDSSSPAGWWSLAQAIRSICNELGVFLCSYSHENSGALFVHLIPQPGGTPSAKKSRSDLRGHTDAVAMPFPNEVSRFDGECPSPDLVILACVRNPNSVATRVAPLSTITKALPRDVIEKLQEPCFDILPQHSFSTPEGYKLAGVPVLVRDQFEGDKVRFSHSKIVPSTQGDNGAVHALDVLTQVVAEAYDDVILRTGDLLLLNNRTAIHGRRKVADEVNSDGVDRWMLRTYGMHRNPSIYGGSDHRPFVLG